MKALFRIVSVGIRPMRVLIVEDHGHTRELMTRLLSRWGYEVAAAHDLQSGLDCVHKEPFDIILSDIALPDGTGYALISEVRRQGQDVMAIALSGYQYPDDVRIAKLTGFDHHLSKPCDCSELRALLEARIVRSQTGRDQAPAPGPAGNTPSERRSRIRRRKP